MEGLDRYEIRNFKAPFFEFIRKSIHEQNLTNNDYFELRDKINSLYF